mmetsp:Transcript_45229/g.52293  ORF Transcript_45229/g.52293 Transcript_45229/m.52293 type:complete len:292 (+) Transcript_45229:57-932(+)
MCFLTGSGLFLICYLLIRSRKLPVKVMRAWFGVVMVLVLLITNILTFFTDACRYLGASADTTKLWSTYVCILTFRLALLLNPHIRIRVDESSQRWADVPAPSVMALNHTSFWDAFVFVGSAPVSYIYNCKTLMKSSLRKLPLFGPVFDRVGHFPVYFKTSADGDFSVDKERQAIVAERVNEHIGKNGRIAIFPEGAINKTPITLQGFRHGSFSLVMQHKLRLYYCITVGNDISWPAQESLGGFPADIDVKFGSFPVDFEKDTVQEVASRLQTKMQQELDAMMAKRTAKKQK